MATIPPSPTRVSDDIEMQILDSADGGQTNDGMHPLLERSIGAKIILESLENSETPSLVLNGLFRTSDVDALKEWRRTTGETCANGWMTIRAGNLNVSHEMEVALRISYRGGSGSGDEIRKPIELPDKNGDGIRKAMEGVDSESCYINNVKRGLDTTTLKERFHHGDRGIKGWKIKPEVFLAAAIGLMSLRFQSQQANHLKLPLRFVAIEFLLGLVAAFGGNLLLGCFPKIANAADQLGTVFTVMGTFTLMGYMLSDDIVWVGGLTCFFTLASFVLAFVERT